MGDWKLSKTCTPWQLALFKAHNTGRVLELEKKFHTCTWGGASAEGLTADWLERTVDGEKWQEERKEPKDAAGRSLEQEQKCKGPARPPSPFLCVTHPAPSCVWPPPPTPPTPRRKTRVWEVGAEGRLIQSGSSGNDVFFTTTKRNAPSMVKRRKV